MDELLKKLLYFATGKKSKIFWATIMIVGLCLFILYPYIDANFMVYNRLNQRIDIIDKVSKLDIATIETVPELKTEYDSIISEIVNTREKTISEIAKVQVVTAKDSRIRFLFGGILFWVMTIVAFFQKNKNADTTIWAEKIKAFLYKILTIIICLGMGVFSGLVGTKIPIIINIWFTAIMYLIVQFIIVWLLSDTPKKE